MTNGPLHAELPGCTIFYLTASPWSGMTMDYFQVRICFWFYQSRKFLVKEKEMTIMLLNKLFFHVLYFKYWAIQRNANNIPIWWIKFFWKNNEVNKLQWEEIIIFVMIYIKDTEDIQNIKYRKILNFSFVSQNLPWDDGNNNKV